MKSFKRISAGLLALLTAFTMLSCSDNGNVDDEPSDAAKVPEKSYGAPLEKNKEPDAVTVPEDMSAYSKEKGIITEYAPVSTQKEIVLDYADEAYMADLDAKAEAMKQRILNSPDGIDLTDKTVYYISNEGNDTENDGRSPEAPFASVAGTADIVKPGDVVLFRRGDLFRGNWKAQEGVTYGAYGEGDKPKMYASKYHGANPEDWTLYDSENSIWRFNKLMIDIGGIIFNDGEAVGYKEIPTWSIVDKKFVLRDNASVDFVMAEQLDNDLDFFCDAASLVDGVPQVSKAENVGYLYLRCDAGNPADVYDSIEFNPRVSGISVGGDNVTIDNLCIKHAGVHGISSGTVDNLTVTNCELGWIGGGIQFYDEMSGRVTRLGNAVEIYGGCHGYIVDNCYIYQCYDAGVTHQVRGENKYYEMYDIQYTNNLFEYNTYSVEYFLSRQEAGNKSKMKNVIVKDNIMRWSGYGWGEQRPDKGSAAHIKSWCHTNAAEDFFIEDNIFDRALHRIHHIGAWNPESVPVLKNNTYIQNYGMNLGIVARYTSVDIPYDYRLPENINDLNGSIYEEGAIVKFITEDGVEIDYPDSSYGEYLDYTKSYSYTTENGYTVPFRMIMPPEYDKSQNYPVILYLGSEYQRGVDNKKQVTSTSEMLESAYNTWVNGGTDPVKAIILAPQCPRSERLIGKELSYGKNYTEALPESEYLAALAELLPKACEYFGGNASNVSVVGHSTGGTAALEFSLKHPELMRSCVAISCFSYTGDLSAFEGKNVYLYHGARDKEIPVENARELAEALESVGANVDYTEFERETHDCWSLVFGSSLARLLIE